MMDTTQIGGQRQQWVVRGSLVVKGLSPELALYAWERDLDLDGSHVRLPSLYHQVPSNATEVGKHTIYAVSIINSYVIVQISLMLPSPSASAL